MTTRSPGADDIAAPLGDPSTSKASRSERVAGRISERVAALPAVAQVDRPTRRRAGVFRRAIRHEINRIRDPRRLTMMIILGLVAGFVLAGLIARGETAGADTRAYWAAGRLWLNGGDPYHPTGPFMPYVYSPWMLPLFVPWSILPWDVAWFVWRGVTVIGLLWSIHWAYRRRPMTTAMLLVLLMFPMAANLDTGN
ncbi:MAG: glycosyltransferase 87 family protein, partial [Candidatus Limnocylindrales bacterium]